MKEATGELNGTVIVVVAVALLAAFFFTVIWPNIKGGLSESARCSDAICDVGIRDGETGVRCYTPGESKTDTFICPYKG